MIADPGVPPPQASELRAAGLAALAEAGLVYLPAHLILSDASRLDVGTLAGALPFAVAYVIGVVLACRFRGSTRTTLVAGVLALLVGVVVGRAGWAETAVGSITGLLVALRVVTLGLRDWREPIHASIGVGTVVLGIEALLATGALPEWRTPLLAVIPTFFVGSLASRVVTVWAPVAREDTDPARASWVRRASAAMLVFGTGVAAAALLAVRGGVLERIGSWLAPVAGLLLSWFVAAVVLVTRPILWLLGLAGLDPEAVRRALEGWRRRLALRDAARTATHPGSGWSGRLLGLLVFGAIVWLLYRSLRRLRADVGAFEDVDRPAPGGPREVPLAEDATPTASPLPFRHGLPSETVRRWYAETLLALRARGIATEPSLTPAELLPQVVEAFPGTAAGFARLTRMYEDVRYGNRQVSGDVVHAFEPEFRRVLGVIRRPS